MVVLFELKLKFIFNQKYEYYIKKLLIIN